MRRRVAESLLVLALAATGCSGSTVNESEPAGGESEAQADAAPLSPAPLPAEGPFRAVATGRLHTCAIRANSTIVCWGDNRHGQIEAPDGRYVAVASGHSHNCAIRDDGASTAGATTSTGFLTLLKAST